MNDPLVQTIASNIILISIGLLASTLVMVGPTWKRFQGYWECSTKESRGRILKASIVPVAIPLVVAASGAISIALFPSIWAYVWPYIIIFLAFALLLPAIVYMALDGWKRFTRQSSTPAKVQADIYKEFGATSALMCFVLTILFVLLAFTGAIDLAVGVQIGGLNYEDNFNAARALTIVAPFTLTCGLAWLGFSYVVELGQPTVGAQEDIEVNEHQKGS